MILFEIDRSRQSGYLYKQSDENLCFQKHAHHSYELITVLSGELECEVENTVYTIKHGQFLLITPGQIHSYLTGTYSKSFLCVFSQDYVASFYNETKDFRFNGPLVGHADAEKIYECLKNEKNLYSIKSALYSVCAAVYRNGFMSAVENRNYTLLSSIALYVQENYTKNPSLKSLAAKLGYNYTYLSDFFGKNFKINFAEYVNSHRLMQASALLKSTDEPITSVSIECGYNTIRAFNNSFKKNFGITPSQYRIRYREKAEL